MNQIIFKWSSPYSIPNDLYRMTDEQVGYSQIDDCPVYSIKFNCELNVLNLLIQDNDVNIFSEVSKQLRVFKIQKIIHKAKGIKYNNEDLDKFSTFLQYYYTEKGNINIMQI